MDATFYVIRDRLTGELYQSRPGKHGWYDRDPAWGFWLHEWLEQRGCVGGEIAIVEVHRIPIEYGGGQCIEFEPRSLYMIRPVPLDKDEPHHPVAISADAITKFEYVGWRPNISLSVYDVDTSPIDPDLDARIRACIALGMDLPLRTEDLFCEGGLTNARL